MVDQTQIILEQYDLEVKSVRKGRGIWIINSGCGDFVLKEYMGSEEKAALQKVLTDQIMAESGVLVQEILPNKEGKLLSLDKEEHAYTLQTFMEGRECNIKDTRECELAVSTMAKIHRGMYLKRDNCTVPLIPYSLEREFEKRNTELRRIRRYLREKRNKNDFERYLYMHFNSFFEKALEVEEDWKSYEKYSQTQDGEVVFCHGDYQHHNVWMNYQEVMVLQWEKYQPDLPSRDLYLFMRKLLEKNNWNQEMGRSVIAKYEKERPLPFIERISMIYRFAYPEKFWKIANYYFNSKKSFMPEKNMEKLDKLLMQENVKERFIAQTLRTLV